MYYILNETNKIIAADESLLELCGVTHIDELSTKIATEDTKFDTLSDERISITLNDSEEIYTISETVLSSLLGHLTLVQVSIDIDETDSLIPSDDKDISIDLSDNEIAPIAALEIKEEAPDLEKPNYDDLLSDDLSISFDTDEESILEDDKNEDTTFDEPLSLDNDTMGTIEDTEEKDSLELDTNIVEPLDDSELFNLDLDETEEKNTDDNVINLDLKDNDLLFETTDTEDISEIVIDVESISNKIGISSNDYNGFLNEFIDTALNHEKDLQSSNTKERTNAIYTLSHLSEILHLPVIGKSLDNIDTAKDDNRREIVESFYTTLSQITTNPSKNIPIENIDETNAPIEIMDESNLVDELEINEQSEITDKVDLDINNELEITDEPTIQEEPIVIKKEINSNSFGTISLEGITPKHFDFQLEEAANDLSLPVELIEEFVHDFIDQAHIETKKMLQAYEDGDLDAIQKIGHLLKGASSNLRINDLADTLYQIQFCEEPSKLERYIKDYWAHFLSFENQINVISN